MADQEIYEYSRRGKLTELREVLDSGTAQPDDFLAYNGASALIMWVRGAHL